MKKMTLEMIVGLFLLAGFVSFAWISIKTVSYTHLTLPTNA